MALLAVHGLVGLALFPTGARLGRRAFLVAALAPLATLVWLLTRMPGVVDGTVETEHVSWVGPLGLAVDLRLDGFAALDGAARRRHRHRRVRLLRGVLLPVEPVERPHRRPAHAVRRRHARRRPRRQPVRALHGLGADVDHVVPADRQRPHQDARPGGRPARPARHVVRRPGDARRLHPDRPGRRHLPPQRAPHPPAPRHHGRRRPRARPPRRVHQVGAVPVPLVAAGRDGRADAGQRLPALGHDGEGRRVPRRPLRARCSPPRGSGGRSCSPSALSRWCSAVCGRCASTTSSCCSPSAR